MAHPPILCGMTDRRYDVSRFSGSPFERDDNVEHVAPLDRLTCNICKIVRFILYEPPCLSTSLGSGVEVLSSQPRCSGHHDLCMSLLRINHNMSAPLIHARASEVHELWINKCVSNKATFITPKLRSGTTLPLSALYPMEGPRKADGEVTGKLVDAQWIDRDLPASWKAACDANHGGLCKRYPNRVMSSIRPAWLVDVKRQCLVQAPPDCSYIALSYVWGNQLTFNTTSRNFLHLQKQGYLSGPMSTSIARTIRDAMGIVELLDEQYLWVDTLCIIQDDLTHKGQEIAKMAMIYSNASVTLIATGGPHANSGLPGFKGISQPRCLKQTIHRLDKNTTVLMTPVVKSIANPYEPGDHNDVWETRGWTYQEYFFSRRRLLFSGTSVRWECESATWREHVQQPSDPRPHYSGILSCSSLIKRIHSPLDLLQDLVNEYHRKEFTYPEDCLHGFAGISFLLSPHLSGGFVSGLPSALFDLALQWEVLGIFTRKFAKNADRASELPSWSWAGWSGGFRFPEETELDIIRKQDGSYRSNRSGIIRTRVWKSHDTPNSIGSPVRASFFDYKDAASLGDFDHSTCWFKYGALEAPETDSSHPNRHYRSHFYKHKEYPSWEFWQPIPIIQPEEAMPPVLSPYISCITQRAWYFCHQERQIPWSWGADFTLRKHDGSWAGSLRPHDGLDASGVALQSPNEPVELVEIAAGYCTNENPHRFLEAEHRERPKSGQWYEFYTVLWVKWVDGIAYRMGLGRVYKERWEADRGEPFRLLLG